MAVVHRGAAATNRLIARLPAKDRSPILAACERVDLIFAEVLAEPDTRIRHVYFPIRGYISLTTPQGAPSSIEVGLVGNEGMYGAQLALGVNDYVLHSLVQGAGSALRMTTANFKREYNNRPALQRLIGRYLYASMGQLAQSALCVRFHRVEARLARWMLMTQDRAHSDRFRITHNFLAWMLGVRRTGVTDAAGALQKKKLITYRRGEVTILDRRGLERASCACYGLNNALYEKLLGREPARSKARGDDASSGSGSPA